MSENVAVLAIPGNAVGVSANAEAAARGAGPLPEFVVGPENRLVPVAIDLVLHGEFGECNPIVFHGPPGVGKSHLAFGLVSAWKARSRQRLALYVPALDFARELTDAIEAQAIEDFRARYRQLSLLAIDGVEHLLAKETAQLELLHTFDALLELGGRMIVTSSIAPEELLGLLPSLQCRLVSGLSMGLVPPAAETRHALLVRLAQWRQIELDEPVAELLANELHTPVPGLVSALIELDAKARLENSGITVQRAREYLAARNGMEGPSLREIAAQTARHFSLKVADLRSPSRRRAVVTARDVAMYLARTLTGRSLKQIGSYFDGRDHTTVSHGCCKTERLLETDPAIRDAVRQLRDRLRVAATPRMLDECVGKKC